MVWRIGKPEKEGRYFVLVDFEEPVISNDEVKRRGVPFASNYTVSKGWGMEDVEVTHWMEVPKIPENEIRFISCEELMNMKEPDPMLDVDDDGITLRWGGYEYFIDWERIKEPNDVVQWIYHVCEKGWEEMTPYRIKQFIDCVYRQKGWDLFNK